MEKTIMQLAAELGQAIKNDERIKRLDAATKAYQTNAELQSKVQQYTVQTTALTEEYKSPEKDMEVIHAIEATVNRLYEEISHMDVMVEYNEAQEEVNNFMNLVNGEITFQITGERPVNCSHDCSSCAGCS